MKTFSLKVRTEFFKKLHKYWILKSKYTTTYIKILEHNVELGFKCELIKLYSDHYSKTETYLQSHYFQNYKKIGCYEYLDIEEMVKEYESDLEDYKKNLFKRIFL